MQCIVRDHCLAGQLRLSRIQAVLMVAGSEAARFQELSQTLTQARGVYALALIVCALSPATISPCPAMRARHPPAEPSGCSAPRGSGAKPSGGGSSSWARRTPPATRSPPPPQIPRPPAAEARLSVASFGVARCGSHFGSHSLVLGCLAVVFGANPTCLATRCPRCGFC